MQYLSSGKSYDTGRAILYWLTNRAGAGYCPTLPWEPLPSSTPIIQLPPAPVLKGQNGQQVYLCVCTVSVCPWLPTLCASGHQHLLWLLLYQQHWALGITLHKLHMWALPQETIRMLMGERAKKLLREETKGHILGQRVEGSGVIGDTTLWKCLKTLLFKQDLY